MLKYLNEKFVNSSKKSKIELFILPIVLIILYFSVMKDIGSEDADSLQTLSFDFESIEMSESFLDIFEKIEKSSQENSVELIENRNYENRFSVKTSSSLKNMVDFLNDLESINAFSEIKRLYIKKTGDRYLSDVDIAFEKFYIKNGGDFVNTLLDENIDEDEKSGEEFIENIEEEIENDLESSNIGNRFKLSAVVGKEAFINNSWLKIGESLDEYRLIKIGKNSVILEKDKNRVEVEFSYAKSLKNRN